MALRLGILNVMPSVAAYEPYLLGPLSHSGLSVEPVWLRLRSHVYKSSDPAHLERFYRPLDRALAGGALDGLLLTGAPIEHLPFSEVRYWPELVEILGWARAGGVKGTLGICWGGLALLSTVGVPKILYPRKLFGVHRYRALQPAHPLLAGGDDEFDCAQSRHGGVDDAEVERAAREGRVTPLAHGPAGGYVLSETPDHRFVMHLGHPEYEAARLVHEWRRDREAARTDVDPPHRFDVERPVNTWRAHCTTLFSSWLSRLAG